MPFSFGKLHSWHARRVILGNHELQNHLHSFASNVEDALTTTLPFGNKPIEIEAIVRKREHPGSPMPRPAHR